MEEDFILKALRDMAWQRAKGELLSICEADLCPRKDMDRDAWHAQSSRRTKLIEAFIAAMEADR